MNTRVEIGLTEEVGAVAHLFAQARSGGPLDPVMTDAVVRSLYTSMHASAQLTLPLCEIIERDRLVARALNAAVLSLALAETLGLPPGEVRAIGFAALLHDVGMVTVPDDVIATPGTLSEQGREVVNQHAAAGARLLIESGPQFELASAVAYEHHLAEGPASYPALDFPRRSHFASRLVQVCDVFDALCSARADRAAYSVLDALALMGEVAGEQLEPELVKVFDALMRSAVDEGRVLWV